MNKQIEQSNNVNKELSGCLEYHIKENKELKEELIEAYKMQREMLDVREHEWIQKRQRN